MSHDPMELSPRKRPKLNADNNPGGARWCEEHLRLECQKQRRRGQGMCHSPAIAGMPDCRMHVGRKGATAKAIGHARITAWQAQGDTGAVIDHKMAVLSVLQMTWLRLSVYSELLRRQVQQEPQQVAITYQDGEDYVLGDPDEDGYEDADGVPLTGELVPSGGPAAGADVGGLIGHRYGMGGKDGIVYRQSEEVRALVDLEAAERDRVVKYAKVAHDMGISDRLTSLAEKWGDVVAGRVTAMLAELGLSDEQQARVPDLVRAHLSSIDMDEAAVMSGDK